MNHEVWVQPGAPPEPAWTAGGTYQVVRIIRMFLDQWGKVPVEEQERIFGRRKVSGAPMYATSPDAPDTLPTLYTNDPEGQLTPLNCHIRLANPQTPETAATSAILRRSYQYDNSPQIQPNPNMGHVFCCFQQQLATYIAMQTRLENETLVPFISPIGGLLRPRTADLMRVPDDRAGSPPTHRVCCNAEEDRCVCFGSPVRARRSGSHRPHDRRPQWSASGCW
ncbi:MAG: deferrochelatase/peroxidase EfeB, partial [Pseudonocardiales bacterium]|nr:deferrochelatase/peroxidase EfeB [Pseudonocardiales bacterium]